MTPETKAGGVHTVLGDLGDGTRLAGIDLDHCFASLQDNSVARWAQEVLDRFATYAEVSPGGLGVKLFFLIDASDVAALQQLLEGKTSKKFGAGEHREIVLDTAKFYAVTDLQLRGVPDVLRVVPLSDVRWFIDEAGPRYLELNSGRSEGGGRRRTRDESGSGFGFRFMSARKAAGGDYQSASAALLEDQGPAGEWRAAPMNGNYSAPGTTHRIARTERTTTNRRSKRICWSTWRPAPNCSTPPTTAPVSPTSRSAAITRTARPGRSLAGIQKLVEKGVLPAHRRRPEQQRHDHGAIGYRRQGTVRLASARCGASRAGTTAKSTSTCATSVGAWLRSTRKVGAWLPTRRSGSFEVVKRGDLADRIISRSQTPITDRKRRRERELWQAFERDRPAILGALLRAVSHGLCRLPHVRADSGPRLADFHDWAIACGDGYLWKAGEFAKAYAANRAGVTADVIEADPLAAAIEQLMKRTTTPNPWTGTATELLQELDRRVPLRVLESKQWPRLPSVLGQRLKRIATPLRRLGIEIVRLERQGHARDRVITITANREVRESLSALSAPTTPVRNNTLPNNGFFPDADRAGRADRHLQTSTPADRVRPPGPRPASAATPVIGARPHMSPNFVYRHGDMGADASIRRRPISRRRQQGGNEHE
jgi:hypothetical protein